jgi:hypothetical protein
MQNEKKRKSPAEIAAAVAFFLLFAGGGAVVGWYAAHHGFLSTDHLELSRWETLGLGILGFVSLPILILWHELGHMAGGKLVGFRPVLLVVGPVRWQKHAGRWGTSANRHGALAGGLAACVPDDTHDLARRTAVLIAGGPLASLLGGVLAVLVFRALPAATPQTPLVVLAGYTLVAAFALWNFLLAAASLVPSKAGGMYSDGARLLRMLRGGPELDRELAILLLTGSSIGGVRPRDWEPDLVRRAVGPHDGSLFHAAGLQFAAAHAQDVGDPEEAHRWVEAMLEAVDAIPPLMRGAVRLAAVYHTVVMRGEVERGRELLREGEGGLLLDRHILALARAAVAGADGDAALARTELDRAEALLPRAIDRGSAMLAADRVAALRAMLATPAPTATTAPSLAAAPPAERPRLEPPTPA